MVRFYNSFLNILNTISQRSRVIEQAIDSDLNNKIILYSLFRSQNSIAIDIIQISHMMLGFVCRNALRMSTSRNILVNEASPFDILINDLPPKSLSGIVSKRLGVNYLSPYKGTEEKLLYTRKRKYQGAIIGDHHRLFYSIPTALYQIQTQLQLNTPAYYYVHFLFDTSSPYSTLTYEAYCCLKGNTLFQPTDYTSGFVCKIANKLVQFHPSNPHIHQEDPTPNFHNANLLGMNFLSLFKEYKAGGNFRKREIRLELID